MFYNPYSGIKYTTSFYSTYFTFYIQIPFYAFFYYIFINSHAIPIELSDTYNHLPPDDPSITKLVVSHYDCIKQPYLRQFSLLNVNHVPTLLQSFNTPKFMSELKPNALEFLSVKLTPKKNLKFVFKA